MGCDEENTILYEVVGTVLGSAARQKADWCRESEADLRPPIEERNWMHSLWLRTGWV